MAEIIVSNKMSSNYSLRGHGELPVLFSVEAGQYEESSFDFDVAIRGEVYNERLFELYVQYGQEENLLFEVQPRINNNLSFEVFVNPHNKMSAVFELLEAPNTIEVFNPIKDTFVASNSPYNVLNYGANNTMKVGYDNYGRSLAYLGFDISSLPENIIINNAVVKVYYNNMYDNQQLEIYRALSEWQEYSLTYNNNVENNMLIDTPMIVNENERYIEFNITNLVNDWYLGIPNNGLALLSQSNTISLRSRETATPPKLEIQYYSALPYLINSSRTLFDVIVRQKTDDEVLFNVDIISYLQKSDTLFEIHAVNRNKLNDGDSENLFEIEVMEYQSFEDTLFEIAVQEGSQDDLLFEVEVIEYEDSSDILFDIAIQDYDDSETDFEIEVIEYEGSSDLLFDITVVKYNGSELEFEVEVPEYNAVDELYFMIGVIDANSSEFGFDVVVSEFDDTNEIQFEVVVQLEQEESILFEVFVNEYFNDSNVLFEISAVAYDKSELIFEVDVNEYSEINELLFEIDIIGIYTKDEALTLFEVIVPIYSAIYENLFEIEVNPRYDNSQLIFEIAVQDYGNSELNFDINPRLLDISQADFDIEISEKSTNKIYVYLV